MPRATQVRHPDGRMPVIAARLVWPHVALVVFDYCLDIERQLSPEAGTRLLLLRCSSAAESGATRSKHHSRAPAPACWIRERSMGTFRVGDRARRSGPS